ncbi:MAG: alanine--glyoxylate aminotransferase family protein [Anaerolineae bacterium]|nr:alanine--glyoxylate aminotransferase family protein [Anaerolineae bacterium]
MVSYPLNMSCGQTDLHPACLAALGRQLGTPIYYPPYWELELETISLLRRLMHTENDVLLITGSATYGEEAAILSIVEPGQKVITVNSGVYGQVLTELVNITGAEPIEIRIEEGKAVTPEQIRNALLKEPDVVMVAVVHCDTSMGTMNPIAEIGAVLTEFPDVLFMVDAVSALGAIELRVDEWGVDVCCTSPQKCVNGPQGLAIVSVSDRAWHTIEGRSTSINSLCLDLTVWRAYHDGVREACESGQWTDISYATQKAIHGPSPSYVLVAGLKAAVEAILDEGEGKVFARHELAARAVREAIRAMGLKVKADEAVAAPVCTCIEFPRGVDWTELASTMLEEHGIALAAGFRIGNMGLAADPRCILPTISALELTMRKLGYDVPAGAGLEAARGVFAGATVK